MVPFLLKRPDDDTEIKLINMKGHVDPLAENIK